jgi:hypothetical protein
MVARGRFETVAPRVGAGRRVHDAFFDQAALSAAATSR